MHHCKLASLPSFVNWKILASFCRGNVVSPFIELLFVICTIMNMGSHLDWRTNGQCSSDWRDHFKKVVVVVVVDIL